MYCKPRPNYCKLPTQTQVMPTQVAPTQQNVVEKTCEYIVPEVYPTHTHYQTNHVYKHVKSFPHTTSADQNIFNQQFVQPSPGPGYGPQVAGAMSPGAGPGYGPQVAGAMSPGAGPGYGPQVAGAMSPMAGYGHKKHCGCNRKF
ncbi:spore coat protein [Halalkalibacter lacteus]|uniref:spore coat protein n=1 Tax=Halalkalibacter lacteus TaxID=3090663 RepID=UPI002FCA9233